MCANIKNPPLNSQVPAIQSGESLKADICKCGTVQIHLGPLSLRYTRAAFEDLYQLVAKIRERIQAQRLGQDSLLNLNDGKKIMNEA